MTSYSQDGGYDVISHRKMLPPGECTHSVSPTPMQYIVLVWPDVFYSKFRKLLQFATQCHVYCI